MHFPFVRFTVRRLLVAVAVVVVSLAVGLWAQSMRGLAERYRGQAAIYDFYQGAWRNNLDDAASRETYWNGSHDSRKLRAEADPGKNAVRAGQQASAAGKMLAYYARLNRKYEFAAAHPWLAVVPDECAPLKDGEWESLFRH
jgi:hypothetical protein